jgi:hypothetical protein
MAEDSNPIIIDCIERTYEFTNNGRKARLKSTEPVPIEKVEETILKEKEKLLNFFNNFEILEIGIASVPRVEHLEPSIQEKTGHEEPTEIEIPLPTDEEVIEYITKKELFEHEIIEMQEKFLGKRFSVRGNTKLYNAFDGLLRRARKQIANIHKITWDTRGKRSYGRRTHVTVYKVKKGTDEQNPGLKSILQSELQPLVGNYTKTEPLNNIIA